MPDEGIQCEIAGYAFYLFPEAEESAEPAVFVFHNSDALERFMDVGISVGGQADAAAQAGDLGGSVSGEAILDNVTVYQLTQSGLALQATIKGTRYWHDADLN